jgi:septal ring factor EnvC (AmiA/AmiB activator)
MRLRFLLPLTALAVTATAGVLWAQEPADAPSPRLMAIYAGSPEDPVGQAEARREIEALREELRRLASQQALSARDLAAARDRLAVLHVRETSLLAQLGQDRGRLARLLSALQLFRRDPPPALLVRPADARDAVRAAILIRAMTPQLQRRADLLAAESREIAGLRRQAAAANADLFSAESLVADRRSDIDRLLARQADIENRYADSARAAGRDLGSPGALVDSFPRAATTGGEGPGRLARPLAGPVIQRFGAALPAGGESTGLSIRGGKSAEVSSPAQGVVEFAGPVTGWGVILILRIGGDYHLVLGGLGEATVAPGQSVAAGAPVGRMGKSGGELYLELRLNGAPVDPAPWLGTKETRVAAGR